MQRETKIYLKLIKKILSHQYFTGFNVDGVP